MSYMKSIVSEIEAVSNLVSEEDINEVSDEIINANRILVVGVGRVLISLKAWVKRFCHIGIDMNYVGSETESAVGQDDILIVASSSGESAVPVKITEIAQKQGVKVIYIGCNPKSTVGNLADYIVRIPCKTKLNLPNEFHSFQPMSTLFEQVLYILGDAIAYKVMDKTNYNESKIIENHANLE